VSWPRNRRHVLIGLPGMEQARTVVLPTSRGGALPDLPTSRTLTQRDLAESPTASIISETNVAPGLNADVFAFTRVSTHQICIGFISPNKFACHPIVDSLA
jgi:hypothetical protein